jgi:tetratricopeptide (TPR) repeat protein
MKDFFISYNKKDREIAEWIAWHIENAGYSVIIQAWDFRPGNNFPLEMDKAAKEANQTIAVLSPDYLRSDFSPSEWAAAFVKDPKGEQRKIIPIRIKSCDLDGLLSPVIYIDIVGLDESDAKKKIIDGIKDGRAKPSTPPKFPKADIQLHEPRFPGALPKIWNVPFNRNPNFTGRISVLEELQQTLNSGSHVAVTQSITGLGGIGKTQIVVEYAYRFIAQYDLVWWVRSENTATIRSDFSRLADYLHIVGSDCKDQKLKMLLVRKWLETNKNWLLIFDNAQEPKDLYAPQNPDENFLPQSTTGHVLITSRNPNWSAIARPFDIQVFSKSEAIEFLIKRTGQIDEIEAVSLAEELGFLPLALEQTGAFIVETPGMTYKIYLKLFKERHQQLWKDQTPPINYQDTIDTTWNLSMERIRREMPLSVDLLNFCAFLASEEIPLDLLNKWETQFSSLLSKIIHNDLILIKAISSLKKFSLIDTSDQFISVHRLVQLVTRDRLNPRQKKKVISEAVQLLNNTFLFTPDDPLAWYETSKILPHALSVTTYALEEKNEQKITGQLLVNIGLHLQQFAEYNKAKLVFEKALSLYLPLIDPNDQDIGTIYNNLGYVKKSLGDFAGAKIEFDRALSIAKNGKDSNILNVAVVYNNLGSVLVELNDLPGAKFQLEQSLRIFEEEYGENSPVTATAATNLGLLLHSLGDFTNAKIQHERALTIDERTYSPDHPSIARDVNNLGLTLQELGDLHRARIQFERALKIYETIYGPNHPFVATAVNNLGRAVQYLGDLPSAKILFERSLLIDERVYGPNHPKIAVTSNNLGMVLKDCGDLSGAKVLFERALKIDEMIYGPCHPTVATDVNNLGMLLKDIGDITSAKSLVERALKINENSYGLENLHVARDLNNLGSILMDLNKPSEAKDHFERAINIVEKQCGPEPEIAHLANNFGHSFFLLKDFSQAKTQFIKALKIYDRVFGPDYPESISVATSLGSIFQILGELQNAKIQFERVLKHTEKTFGSSHPQTALVASNLGVVLKELDDLNGAKKMFRRALKIHINIYGPDSPEIARDLNNLGTAQMELGDIRDALASYKRALKLLMKYRGKNHPDTVAVRENFEKIASFIRKRSDV